MRASLRAAALALLTGVLATLSALPGKAQTGTRPTITVSENLTVASATQSPMAIRVGPAAALPRNCFLRIRGLPPMAALSEGHSIAPGAWAVPIAALADLKIALPADAAGKSEVSILLVAIDGSVLAEAKTTLIVSAVRTPTGVAEADRGGKAPAGATMLRAGADVAAEARDRVASTGPSGRPMTPEDRERGLRLFQKGEAHLAEGNISSARLIFEKAADAGHAQAAMALAGTFDAAELARMGVRGIQADEKQARFWYERALQLGAREAEQRLRRLGSTN